jgi:hypothetical protein
MTITLILAAIVIFAAGILAAAAVIVRWGTRQEARDGSVSCTPPGPVVPGACEPGDLYGRLPHGASGTLEALDGREERGSWPSQVRPLASSAANGPG